MVLRGATLVFACLLIATGVSAVDQGHYLNAALKARSPAAPATAAAQFKEQARTEATSEAAMRVKLSRTQATLEHETKMLALQQEEAQLLQQLKATSLARERAEETLVHSRLLVSQRETARLVNQLQHMSIHRVMTKLQKLNDVLTQALGPKQPIEMKLMQHKQTPAAAGSSSSSSTDASGANAASPTSGPESDAKKQLHKQLVAKAAEVVDAQLDGILNSEELAYIKAHNDLGDTDSSQTQDGDIVEQDTGANPGETPDEHYNRLSKEADALMAKAYPFIKCQIDAGSATGGSGHGTGGTGATGTGAGSGGTGGTGETGTGATGGSGATGATGTGGSAGTAEAATGAGSAGAAATTAGSGAAAATTAAAGGETGATAAGATGGETASSSTA